MFDYPPYGYRALCDHLGIQDVPEPISAEGAGTVLNIDDRLRERLHGDVRWIDAGSSAPVEHTRDGGVVDDWGFVRYRSGPYWDVREDEAPLRNARDSADLDQYTHWPDTKDPAIAAGKPEQARKMKNAGYAVIAWPNMAQAVFHNYAFLRGFGQWLIDMYENPRLYHDLVRPRTRPRGWSPTATDRCRACRGVVAAAPRGHRTRRPRSAP